MVPGTLQPVCFRPRVRAPALPCLIRSSQQKRISPTQAYTTSGSWCLCSAKVSFQSLVTLKDPFERSSPRFPVLPVQSFCSYGYLATCWLFQSPYPRRAGVLVPHVPHRSTAAHSFPPRNAITVAIQSYRYASTHPTHPVRRPHSLVTRKHHERGHRATVASGVMGTDGGFLLER